MLPTPQVKASAQPTPKASCPTAKHPRVVQPGNCASLDHTDPVGNIKGIKVLAQSHVALLEPPGCNKSVDLVALNVVQVLNGRLDLALVGLDVHNEDEGVGVFDELHGGLGGEGVLDDRVLVQRVLLGGGPGGVLRFPGEGKGLRPVEVDLGVDSGALLGKSSLRQLLGDRRCLGCSHGCVLGAISFRRKSRSGAVSCGRRLP
mmetsp:Transcript_22217/g.44962  ORF Transcript_22217/g.44962 Transcript_22217/m.44962 type:complete len:203 (-) Transcript_22217:58-666(-)